MAGLPDGFTMLPEGQAPIANGVTFATEDDTVHTVPPASYRTPQRPQSVPRPSTSANPVSPPGTMPTGTAGQSSTGSTAPYGH
eukprot:609459-Amphidinium_carterae.1